MILHLAGSVNINNSHWFRQIRSKKAKRENLNGDSEALIDRHPASGENLP